MIVAVAGIDVHVEGEGEEAIVMVHGWPDTYRLWDAQVEFLKAKYRCIRFSLPGFDETQPRRVYTVDEVTEIIRQVIEQLSPGRKVTLMLHDWGCIYGYEFYMRNPELVARIIGLDIGDARGLRHELTARSKFYILAYQVWLALAWKIGGRLGDWMTRKMALGPRAVGSALHQLADELPLLPRLVRRRGIVRAADAAVQACLPHAFHLRRAQALHVPRQGLDRSARPAAGQPGGRIRYRPLGNVAADGTL